jgi:hypothetical protein
LSDNHGVRLSLKTINEELKRLGSRAVLTKADGYFYFQGGDARLPVSSGEVATLTQKA